MMFSFYKINLGLSKMRLFDYYLMVFSLLFSCGLYASPKSNDCNEHLESIHLENNVFSPRLLQVEIDRFLLLAEKSLVYREQSLQVVTSLRHKIDRDIPLSGDDLDVLNQGVIAHLDLRKSLYQIAEHHECWIKLKPEQVKKVRLDSLDHLKAVMLSLSAGLLLYDNYLVSISLFEKDKKLRRFLNSRDQGYKKGRYELLNATLSFDSVRNRHRMRQAIKFYEKTIKKVPEKIIWQDDSLSYLNLLISQSISYNSTKVFSPFYVAGRKLKSVTVITRDLLNKLSTESMNLFSGLFGNSLGLVQLRRGLLYQQKSVEKELRHTLRAGDILLEKTPFRLTDKLIPGFWGHVAIWIGTEKELKDLGIWNHPIIVKYHEQIKQQKQVVEALRSGVELNQLSRFLNIDDLAILRFAKQSKEDRIKTIIQTFRQIGKSYDFNFDVETTDKIVCSELVYVTFTSFKWPTVKTLGRATISPDNVASKIFSDGTLELMALYLSGKKINKNATDEFKRLIRN